MMLIFHIVVEVISKHTLLKKIHRIAANAASNQKVNIFLKDKKLTSENLIIAEKVGTFAYHAIKHMQSFRSLDCTSKLIASLFETKFSLARTKTEAIITNDFAKEAEFRFNIALDQVHFFSVIIDSSNHNCTINIRYFDINNGIQMKLL